MRTMRWVLAMATVLTAGAVPGEAARTSLEGSRWDLSGRVVISGVARSGRRRVPFREGRPVRLDTRFPTSSDFEMTDADNTNYTGTYVRDTLAREFDLTPDDATEDVLERATEDWLADLTGSNASVVSIGTEATATVRFGRMRLVLDRSYGATTTRGDEIRGHYRIRASGYETRLPD